jgi:hypothetical protein
VHEIEAVLAERQSLGDVSLDEHIIFGCLLAPLPNGRISRCGRHDVDADDVCLRELLGHLCTPAASAATYVEDVMRRAHGRHEIASEHIAQHVVLQIKPVALAYILGQ